MKKFRYIIVFVIIVLLATILLGCSNQDYNKSLIKGASNDSVFNYYDLAAAKKDWDLTISSSTDEYEDNAFSFAENGLTITIDGYARAAQKIKLKPRAYYKVSYDYTIESPLIPSSGSLDIGISNYDGLYIGFEEDPNFNRVGDKKTQNIQPGTNINTVFYLKADDTRYFNLFISLGSKESPVSGRATINNLSVVRVKETVATTEGKEHGLYEIKTTILGKASEKNIIYIVLGALLIAILSYMAYIFKSRDLAFTDNTVTKNKAFNTIRTSSFVAPAILIGITLLVRVLILAVHSGMASGKSIVETLFGYNLEQLSHQGQWLAKLGTPYFYEYNPQSNFFILPLYLSSLAGLIGRAAKTTATAGLLTVSMLKLFAILADVGSVLVIYKIFMKRHNKSSSLIFASLYSLMPIFFLSSASGWNLTMSLGVLFVLLAVYNLLENKYILTALFYFLSCMTTPAALLFVPIFLLYTLVVIIDGVRDKNIRNYITPILTIVISLIAYYLITLPFSLKFIQKGEAMHAFQKYIDIVKGQNFYTLNSFNFQGLLKNNFLEVTSQSTLVAILFGIFLVVVVGLIYLKSKNRLQLISLGTAFALMYWYFLNNMTPGVLVLILPMLLVSAVLYKDSRLYLMFALFMLTAYINISYENLIIGYNAYGILPIDYSQTPIIYVLASFNLLFLIIYTIVLYDVVISKKILPFTEISTTYFKYVKKSMNSAVRKIKAFNMKISEVFYALKEERKERKIEKKKNKELLAEIDKKESNDDAEKSD